LQYGGRLNNFIAFQTKEYSGDQTTAAAAAAVVVVVVVVAVAVVIPIHSVVSKA